MPSGKVVAVIGGGVSGISAAHVLAQRGFSVKLFEASEKLGGCCGTTRLEGFAFNDGALFISFPELLEQLFGRLKLNRRALLPLHQIDALQTSILPNGTVVQIDRSSGIISKRDSDIRVSDRTQEELQRFILRWSPLLDSFSSEIMTRQFSLPRFMAKCWTSLPLFRGTAADVLRASFSDRDVRAVLGSTLAYTGMSPEIVPASALLGLAAMLRSGYFVPVGGMGRIPDVLSQSLREFGAEIFVNANVSSILLKDSRVHSLDVPAVGRVPVDFVISSTSAMRTVETLLNPADTPKGLASKAKQAKLSHKGLVIQLGLKGRIASESFLVGSVPFLEQQSQLFQPQCDYWRWPSCAIPTAAAPELAPPDQSIVELFPPVHQDLQASDWTEERKSDVANQAIEGLRRFYDFDIATTRIISPREFQDKFHLHSGALYGLAPFTSPNRLFGHRTSIDGLYQTGQTTWPGFGVVSAAMSGVLAAETVIADSRP